MLWMRLWFLVDLKWIGIENATLSVPCMCTYVHSTCTNIRKSETTRVTKILNACTRHTVLRADSVWNVSKCWHKIRKMINAVCAFLRLFLSPSLHRPPSLSRSAILLLAFYLWMAGAKKGTIKPFGCVACDACITTTTTQSLVCVFFIILLCVWASVCVQYIYTP